MANPKAFNFLAAYPKAFKFLAGVIIEVIAYWGVTPRTLVELKESAAYVFRTEL
jgi:hypothetical protein